MAQVQNSNERSTLSANFYHSDVSWPSTSATNQDGMLLGFGHSEQQEECTFNAIKSYHRRSRDQNVILLDSVASEHTVWCKNQLGNLRSIKPRDIYLGDGNQVNARHSGTLLLRKTVEVSGEQFKRSLVLQDVLYVPDLHSNLISCSRLCETGYLIHIGIYMCNGVYDGIIQFQRRKSEGVYHIVTCCVYPWSVSANTATSNQRGDPDDKSSNANDAFEDTKSFWKLWHERLGHAHFGSVKQLRSRRAVAGMDTKGAINSKERCDSCMR